MSYWNSRLYRNLFNECAQNIYSDNTVSIISDDCKVPWQHPYKCIILNNYNNKLVSSLTSNNTINIFPEQDVDDIIFLTLDLEAYSYYKDTDLQTPHDQYVLTYFKNIDSVTFTTKHGSKNIDINSYEDAGQFGIFELTGICSEENPHSYYYRIENGYTHTCLCFKVCFKEGTKYITTKYAWIMFNIGEFAALYADNGGYPSLKVSFNYSISSNLITISNISIVLSNVLDTYIPTYEDCLSQLAILKDLLDIPNSSISSVSSSSSKKFLIYDESEDACKYSSPMTAIMGTNYAELKTVRSTIYVNNQFVRYCDLSGASHVVSNGPIN